MATGATEAVQLTVEVKTQYGVKAGGVNYSYSKFAKDKSLEVGDVVEAEIYTGGKGGKYINSFKRVGNSNTPPMPPALPPTTVGDTKAPGGTPPVSPAVKKSVDSEKMTKADWNAKDAAIELVAVMKSSLESPALAQLAVGKRRDEFFTISREFIKFNLETLKLAKENSL